MAEVKARAGGGGFKTLERWLGDNDLLFLRRDRSTPLVVMPWSLYEQLMREVYTKGRNGSRLGRSVGRRCGLRGSCLT